MNIVLTLKTQSCLPYTGSKIKNTDNNILVVLQLLISDITYHLAIPIFNKYKVTILDQ